MALSDITDYVKTTLQGISGLGQVHTFEPVALQAGQVPATMGGSGTILYWTVKRESTSEQRLTNVETERQHTIVVRGYREVGDASVSESAFQAQVETVMQTFRPTYQVPTSTGAHAELFGPMQCRQVGHRVLAETFLVHYAELAVEAQERVTP